MEYGTAKKRAIQLINEYSNNGNIISASTNADYSLRFPMLADDCQNEISDKVGIDATYTIDSSVTPVSTANGYKKYAQPPNYKQHNFINLDDERFYDYRIENGYLLIPEGYTGTFVWSYYRYPTEINDSTSDSYEFEVEAHTHRLIPYYIAGMVIADEKEGISNKLLNIYYEQLGKARKRNVPHPTSVRIVDRYGVATNGVN
jgi:hypothetical protein